MTVRTMRWVDRFAGVPLCWLAGAANSLRRAHAPPLNDGDTILVLKFFGLGSIVQAAPFLHALRQAFPSSPICFLSFSKNAELLSRLPYNLTLLTITTTTPLQFFSSTLRVLHTLMVLKPKAAFDLEFFSKFSTLLSTLSRARVRVGFALPTRWRRWNLTHSVPLDTSLHVSDVFLSQLRSQIPILSTRVERVTFSAAESEIQSLLAKLDGGVLGERKLVVINPNAGEASLERRWPAERFAGLMERLLFDDSSRYFVIVGSADERNYVEMLLASLDGARQSAFNLAGSLSAGEFIALAQRAEVVITNDSGPMHIAAAAGARVVALFGPESPRFYGPGGNTQTLYAALSCSPCLTMYNAKYFVCPYNAECMQSIHVSDVVAAVRSQRTIYAQAS